MQLMVYSVQQLKLAKPNTETLQETTKLCEGLGFLLSFCFASKLGHCTM